MSVYFIDRKTGELKKEVIAGEKLLYWLNETKSGKSILEILIKRKLFSKLYGKLQDLSISKRKINKYVDELAIDLDEAKIEDIKDYSNFNDFFTRKLKKEARPIILDDDVLISPADGKILAYENIDINKVIQVKGIMFTLKDLLLDDNLAKKYEGGTYVIVRLAPSDYHRYHFPDSGFVKESKPIKGHYYSVNPIALKKTVDLYCQNKREITIFQSDNFNDILFLEVGATCVGSIIQTYNQNTYVYKGAEKGYFKFGGSTVILLFKKDVITVDYDILNNTNSGYETKVNMGERIGIKNNSSN